MTEIEKLNSQRNREVNGQLQKRYNLVHKTIMESNNVGLQEVIDNGQAWTLEGSYGRMASNALKSGACVCADSFYKDSFGNVVPAWWALSDGTQGTLLNAERYYEIA